jgi:hypothetical protein
VIGFDRVVGVLLHDGPRLGHELVEHPRVRRGSVGGHRGRQCPGEEPAGGRHVPLRRGQDVDDLSVLVDRPIQVHPSSGDLQVGLVDEPVISGDVPAGPGSVDQLGGEPLHPPVNRDVVHHDAALGQEFFHVAVGQGVPQVPAHRQHDDLPCAKLDCGAGAAGRCARTRSRARGPPRALRPGGLLILTSRNWERQQPDERYEVERGGRRALVTYTWAEGVADVTVTVEGKTVAERLTFWPFAHETLLTQLREAGLQPTESTVAPDVDRYLVIARRA